MNDDGLADRRRAIEDGYFRTADDPLTEEARRLAARDVARQRMSERLGTADDALLRHLEALGLSEETVPLIHLVPLVYIAWSEGAISPRVQQHIIDVSREHGIADSSEADRRLGDWLRITPPVALVDGALLAIGTVLQQTTARERDRYTRKLFACCTSIAAASGGVLGLGRISSRERAGLNHIRDALEQTRLSATTRLRTRGRPPFR